MKSVFFASFILGVLFITVSQVHSQNLLIDGNFSTTNEIFATHFTDCDFLSNTSHHPEDMQKYLLRSGGSESKGNLIIK